MWVLERGEWESPWGGMSPAVRAVLRLGEGLTKKGTPPDCVVCCEHLARAGTDVSQGSHIWMVWCGVCRRGLQEL